MSRAHRHLALRHAGSSALLSAALLLLGCGESDAWTRPSDVHAELADELGTVVRVSWQTDASSIGYVEYGPTPAMEWSTPLETSDARSHSQLLLGLTGDADYWFRVVTWDGREAGASAVQSVHTGSVPDEFASFTQEGAGLDGFVVLPLQGPAAGVVIVDADGQVVWYHRDDSGLEPFRARLAADMASVLYNVTSVDDASSEDSAIVRVALDGSETSSIRVPFLAHDFVELPDGKLAALVVEQGEDDQRGDAIVEVDPNGELTKVWSVSDCFDPALTAGDGTYANALDYVHSERDPSARAYYVGLRDASSVAKILRETGECEWVLGSTGASLSFAEDATPFVHQSGFDAYSNRLLVMDNRLESDASRVVEYEVDLEAGTARELESYEEPSGAFVGELGAVTRLVNGSWFVNWGEAGRMELVEDGASVWQLSAPTSSFGYHSLAETLYAGDARRP